MCKMLSWFSIDVTNHMSVNDCFRYVWGGLLVIAGIYLNIYGKKTKGSSTPFLVSLQQLYMALQRSLAPKVSTIKEGDSSMFNV